MRPQVQCVRCGAINELNRLFCVKCGTRLDMTKMARHGSSGGCGAAIAGLFRTAFYLLVFAVMGLMLWPATPSGAPGEKADGQSLELKRQALMEAIEDRLSVTEEISEKEVNAYLAAVLAKNSEASASKGLQLGIREINLTFTPTHFVVLIVAGWGPIQLTYEITGTPEAGADPFGVNVAMARWGHLPLPGRAGVWMSGRMAGVFSRMEEERRVLDHLAEFELGEGSARLVTRSGEI